MEALNLPRSPHWPQVRAEHLRREPACQACGTTQHLEVHHIAPFHLHPERELDAANLISLCETPARNCHLTWGHCYSWLLFNATVRSDTAAWRQKVQAAHESPLPKTTLRISRMLPQNLLDLFNEGDALKAKAEASDSTSKAADQAVLDAQANAAHAATDAQADAQNLAAKEAEIEAAVRAYFQVGGNLPAPSDNPPPPAQTAFRGVLRPGLVYPRR